jgi:hypothetical protein
MKYIKAIWKFFVAWGEAIHEYKNSKQSHNSY